MSTEVKQEGSFKIKKKTPKKLVTEKEVTKVDLSKFESANNPDIIKVDLSKPTTNETEENKRPNYATSRLSSCKPASTVIKRGSRS